MNGTRNSLLVALVTLVVGGWGGWAVAQQQVPDKLPAATDSPPGLEEDRDIPDPPAQRGPMRSVRRMEPAAGPPPGLEDDSDIPEPPRRPEQARGPGQKLEAFRTVRRFAPSTEAPPGLEDDAPGPPARQGPNARALLRRIEELPNGAAKLEQARARGLQLETRGWLFQRPRNQSGGTG